MIDDLVSPEVIDYYPPLKRVCQYVEMNYKDKITLTTVSDFAGFERSYFSSYFSTKTGVTFTEYLRHYRIMKSKELIESSDHTMIYVCHEVGFNDYHSFYRSFKVFTDMTPIEYKKSVIDSMNPITYVLKGTPAETL